MDADRKRWLAEEKERSSQERKRRDRLVVFTHTAEKANPPNGWPCHIRHYPVSGLF